MMLGNHAKYPRTAIFAIFFLPLCMATRAQTPSAEQAKKVFTLEQAVDVQTGELDGKAIEVIGGLHDGDEIAARGSDELRPGTHVVTEQIKPRQNSEVTRRQKHVPLRIFSVTK